MQTHGSSTFVQFTKRFIRGTDLFGNVKRILALIKIVIRGIIYENNTFIYVDFEFLLTPETYISKMFSDTIVRE